MKTAIFGIAGLAIASLFSVPAFADVAVSGGFGNSGTRVIIQFGNSGQYSSYDPYPRPPHFHPNYSNTGQVYRQPVTPYFVPSNPYNLPTNYNPYNLPSSSNPYNLPALPTPGYSYPVYPNNPSYYHRHHRRYYSY
jgi:hypothetical protein